MGKGSRFLGKANRRFLGKAMGLAMGLALVASVAVPGVSDAAPTPLFTQCPAAGPDTGCGVLVTVNADGSTSAAVDPGQPALSPDAVLVGIVNNSNVTLDNVALTGGAAPGAFALVTGQGLCAVNPTPCFSKFEYGTTSYEGPGVSFAITDPTHGTVSFAGGVSPGKATYFSLRDAPTSISASLQAAIDVTTAALTPYTNVPTSGTVATFTDGGSTAPPTEFTATTNWGDGTTTASSVSQPGGTGTSYVVADSHTYGTPGPYPVTVTVTDTVTTAIVNTGHDTVSVLVVTQPVTITGAAIPAQVEGTAFSGTVATFTDLVPAATAADFTASIDWGAQAGGVEQIGAGTISGPSGPGNTFTVSGANTYAVSGNFTIEVTVTYQGVPTTVGVPVEVDIQQVTQNCTGNCNPGVTTPVQTSTVVTNSPIGSLTVAISDGTLDCGTGPGGIGYDHAPQITTESTSGIPSSTLVKVHVTFLRRNLQGPVGVSLGVCFESNVAFTPKVGWTLQTVQTPAGPLYVGLLPTCTPTSPQKFGPCLGRVSEPLPGWKTVQENIRFPAGDPRHI